MMINKYTLFIIRLWGFVMILSPLQVYAKSSKDTLDSLQVLQFQVEGVVFEMRRIEGGLFVMGGTAEQHQEVISTDLPTHTVSLDAYYIASTEVTVSLWKALMPEWYIPDDWNTANHPITNITWYDCQEFIRRLDSITGLPFRLPTEAEWEFAARGGNASKGYRFAGSNKIEDVGWGFYNAGFKIHRVGCKQPNELGLYDMTGNVSEWCSDWYGRYYLGTEPNPQGADKGEWKVIRGGSFDNCKDNSYISRREFSEPYLSTNYCGFRLALTLPNDPSLQAIEEPAIVKKIKINNLRIKMIYVPAKTPYYISEYPINQRVWQRVNNLPMVEFGSKVVIDKTDDDWNCFIEKCRKHSRAPLFFATTDEVNHAARIGITHIPEMKKNKQHRWKKNTRSIQRHRRMAQKTQKWADLIGVEIKTTDDPTLQLYNNQDQMDRPRWFVLRFSENITKIHTSKLQ